MKTFTTKKTEQGSYYKSEKLLSATFTGENGSIVEQESLDFFQSISATVYLEENKKKTGGFSLVEGRWQTAPPYTP